MDSELKRKEIWLHQDVLDTLEDKAKLKGWSLKRYLEAICIRESIRVNKAALSEYASSMGEFLMKGSNNKKK